MEATAEMMTRDEILAAVRERTFKSETLDGRDFSRLVDFFPASDWPIFGFRLKEGEEAPEPKDLTRENVLSQLADDLDFAFEKAIDKRGISASSMYAVVKMWMWVLRDPLKDSEEYAQYGLPLLKAVAVKYGLPNPIGDDNGDEDKYASD